jgi:hypothetical protein
MWVHQGELNCLNISTPTGLVRYLGQGAAGVGSAFCRHHNFEASEGGPNKCTSSELPAKGLMVLSNVTPHSSAVTPNKSALICLRIGVTERALSIIHKAYTPYKILYFTALCKKIGGRHFGKFENKQDKIDPKLGFAPPGAR